MMTSVLPVAAPPHDESPRGPAEVKASPERRSPSAFSSTLRSVQRTHGVSKFDQRPKVSEPRQDGTDEHEKPTARPGEARQSSEGDDGKVRSRSVGATVDARRESGESKEVDTETPASDGTGMPVTRDHSETMLREQLDVSINEEAANMQGEAVLAFESEKTPEVLDAELPSGLKSGMVTVGFSTAAFHGSSAQPLSVANGTEDRRQGESDREGPVAQLSDSDGKGVSRSTHQARRPMMSEASLNDMIRAEPDDSLLLTGEPEKGSFSEPSRSPAVVTKGDGSSVQGHGGDAGRLLDRTTPGPSYFSEIRDHDIRDHDKEFTLTEEPHRADQPTESGDRTPDLDRLNRNADSVREEAESIQKSHAQPEGNQEVIAHRFGMAASSESATQSNLGDSQRQVDPMSRPQRSSIHGSDGDKPGSVVSRSVAFEVSRPDLGHVNVRVAVRNDLVHAHLFSDRPDVAQYLAAGHDRLQSALQANGLEMGQFRVDVDRHGGGRSFHQGPSYDQDRTWQPERPAPDRQPMMPETRTYTGIPYAGMLNVVA
ncbi:MAG: flagellar hook-length control protein FliK [Nitrospira sp.]|nr:flagellar hook-length control protein FliK [Nitrospira sp.]